MSNSSNRIARELEDKISLMHGENQFAWRPSVSDEVFQSRSEAILNGLRFSTMKNSMNGNTHWYAEYLGRKLGYLTEFNKAKISPPGDPQRAPFRATTWGTVLFTGGCEDMGMNLAQISKIAFEGTEEECKRYLADSFARLQEFYNPIPVVTL